MWIEIFCSGPLQTNCILIACPKTRQTVIVDAPQGIGQILQPRIQEMDLFPESLFLTHSHWDHIAEAAHLKKKFNLSLFVHQLDAPNVESPGVDGLPFWIDVPKAKVDVFLEGGEEIQVGELVFQVIHTPGHSPGGVCFYLEKQATLLSGDTLFRGSIGNLSFSTAEPEKMWKSLEKLAKLPPQTRVIPGHGKETTIESERWLRQAKEYFGGYL